MHRYYDPARGRFTSPDPAGADAANLANLGTWNQYAYVNGDPVNYNDPSGLSSVELPPVGPGYNCPTVTINYAAQFGQTIQQMLDSDARRLGLMSFFGQQGSGSSADTKLWAALDWTFLNRWDLSAKDKAWFYGPNQMPTTFAATATTGHSRSQVFTSQGNLQAGFATDLLDILTGPPDSSQCAGLAIAIDTAMGAILAHNRNPIPGLAYIPNPVPGSLAFGSSGAEPSHGGYVTQTPLTRILDRGNVWTFFTDTYTPPPPRIRRSPSPPHPGSGGRRRVP
jgi:hypothetical protein